MSWTPEQRAGWERDGFVLLERFAPPATCKAMHERIVALARDAAAGRSIAPAYTLEESRVPDDGRPAEERLSKLFRVHRQEPVFNAFCREPQLLDWIEPIVGPALDCFLSQFIFKNPGALGQPWHQDAFYFPFDREPQVGVWLAITRATLENGPLWVLPGSHREPIHRVVRDPREGAPVGYVEIVDHEMDGARPMLLEPGDLLIFHSHLMHRSTDNRSDGMRAAMVFHYTPAGTVDGTEERFGFKSPNNDFLRVR